jgi:hypothetical protein
VDTCQSLINCIDRDRGTPRGATPPTPPGIRVTYHGGSTRLSWDRDSLVVCPACSIAWGWKSPVQPDGGGQLQNAGGPVVPPLPVCRPPESGETERVEIAVAQGLLDRRMSGHAPETGRRTGGDRCIELGYATTAQFIEAVSPTHCRRGGLVQHQHILSAPSRLWRPNFSGTVPRRDSHAKNALHYGKSRRC